MQRSELANLSRDELVERAERLGVARPRALTQPELVDEIVSRTTKGERERARARGWLGRARDLIAGVVEKGLHLPEVARVLRATPAPEGSWPSPPPPLPTVTLAEIYAAQGHLERALSVLDEVLAREPEHAEARRLRERFAEQARGGKRRTSPPPEPFEERHESESERVARAAQAEADTARAAQAEADTARAAEDEGEADTARAAEDEGEADTARAAEDEAKPAPVAEAVATCEVPTRYDVDEIVAIPVDPTTIYLYWEVKPTTMARARARRPGGSIAIRIVSVMPTWDGPAKSVRDVRVDPLFGDVFVRDLPPGAHVRVSVGWLADPLPGEPDFEPFAVGVELSAPRAIPSPIEARDVARWSPPFARGAVPPVPWRPGGAPAPGAAAAAIERMQQRMAAAGAPSIQAAAPSSPEARPVSPHGTVVVDPGWTSERRGGASDWIREWGPGREQGGASDLVRGGASELFRR